MYKLQFTKEAKKNLAGLSKTVARRIVAKIYWLSKNFERVGLEPLGYDFKNLYKLRVGNWRIAFNFNNKKKLITIHLIDHRDKIYKRRRK